MSAGAPCVAVSGIGTVSAAGLTREDTWARVLSGRTAIGPVAAFDCAAYAAGIAGEAGGFDPVAHFGARRARRLDRCHQLALVAAREALADARLAADAVDPERVAVVIGSSLSGTIGGQTYERLRLREGRLVGRHLYDYLLHACVEHLTAEFGFRGPRVVFSTACTASTIAIGYALELLRSGRADVVLTGGVDPLAELSYAGFSSMGNVSAVPCSPFSEPIGLTVGEAAAMLVLEPEAAARRRGATVRARLLGYGLSADAYHPTSGDPTGRPQARAARGALAMSGLEPERVDYVNAHGTGTAGNDPVETRALRLLLGERAGAVPVSSLKGTVGHTLGAAGAFEAAMTALALERDVVPPTANFTRARTGCDLDYVPNTARAGRLDHALSLNFAFGGNNAALVIGAGDGPAPALPPAPRRRVVVTGLGVVSPIGAGVDELRAALAGDRGGVAPIARFDTAGLGSALGAAIADFAPAKLTRADLRRADRIGGLTVCAADLALRDAGLRVTAENQERIGLVAGTANGPLASCRRFYEPVAAGAGARANPAVFPNTVVNAGAGLAAMHLRIKGPNAALSCGHAAGLAALCTAYDLVRGGAADAILAGGVEELERCTLEGYAATRRIAPHERHGAAEACAPFDRRRSGLVLGEGGTFVVLEALEAALARGARIYGEVVGWAANADRPLVRGWDPSGTGLAHCMSAALADAGVAPAAVDAVAAAAMSHPLHDLIEARAIRTVFGARRVPVVAPASRVGVSAATAPLAAAALALGMAEDFTPGGVAREQPDRACDVDLLEGAARPGGPAVALVNAAALGGSNYTLVLRRWAAA